MAAPCWPPSRPSASLCRSAARTPATTVLSRSPCSAPSGTGPSTPTGRSGPWTRAAPGWPPSSRVLERPLRPDLEAEHERPDQREDVDVPPEHPWMGVSERRYSGFQTLSTRWRWTRTDPLAGRRVLSRTGMFVSASKQQRTVHTVASGHASWTPGRVRSSGRRKEPGSVGVASAARRSHVRVAVKVGFEMAGGTPRCTGSQRAATGGRARSGRNPLLGCPRGSLPDCLDQKRGVGARVGVVSVRLDGA
jgi:hypothetical protein